MGKLLPAVQFLQKSIQQHLDAVSKLYVSLACSVGRVGDTSPAGYTPGLCLTWGQKVLVLQVLVRLLLMN